MCWLAPLKGAVHESARIPQGSVAAAVGGVREVPGHVDRAQRGRESHHRIIAGADDLETLEDQLAAVGENPEKAIFDRVEEDDICLGGAELL